MMIFIRDFECYSQAQKHLQLAVNLNLNQKRSIIRNCTKF